MEPVQEDTVLVAISDGSGCLHSYSFLVIDDSVIMHHLCLVAHVLDTAELHLDHSHALSSPLRERGCYLALRKLHPYFVHAEFMVKTPSFTEGSSSDL